MRFAAEVPVEAMAARPWAKPTIIGPPPGQEHRIRPLMVQVDEKTTLGRGFRFFVELEEGDLGAIARGDPIEFVVYTDQLMPVSVAVLRATPYPPSLIDPGTGSATPEYPFKAAWAMTIQDVQNLIDENIAMRKETGRA